MIVYIDDILVMGESPEQVKGHLEALTYLLTGLGFVINTPKSITTPSSTNRISGIAGRLDHFTPKSTRRETLSHQVRDRPNNKEELSNNCEGACPNNWETACSISSSPPCSPVLQVPPGRPADSFKQQQSELQFTADPVPTSPGGVSLVARQIEPL